MSNPIFDSFRPQRQTQPNSLSEVYNKIRTSPNPNKTMQELLANNPTFRQVMTYINQNGGNAKAAFYNLAAQKGVDPNTILNQLHW